jgi:hypothetical protein
VRSLSMKTVSMSAVSVDRTALITRATPPEPRWRPRGNPQTRP